jgi:hypothetical protein
MKVKEPHVPSELSRFVYYEDGKMKLSSSAPLSEAKKLLKEFRTLQSQFEKATTKFMHYQKSVEKSMDKVMDYVTFKELN